MNDNEDFIDIKSLITPEEAEANKKRWHEEKVKMWNESFCDICPLSTENAKRSYLQLGTFRCDDPMDKICVISRSCPAKTIDNCDIVKNIYDIYNVERPQVEKLLKIIDENPDILRIIEEVIKNE